MASSIDDTDPVSTMADSKPVEMAALDSTSKPKGAESQSSPLFPSAIASSEEPAASNTPQSQPNAPASSENKSQKLTSSAPATTAKVGLPVVLSPSTASVAAASSAAETASKPNNTESITIGSPGSNSPPMTDGSGPVCSITLLLTSGARHPYKLDEKYLIKRNVNVPGTTESGRKDPFSISVYTLKELILREWRDEWEVQPSSPSSIRLIHFGRLLDDKMPLKECRFNTDSPNVVHMTVRPQEVVDEEDATKSKSMGRDGTGSERTAGCRCVIM